jgi:choline dehydrogenase-like flavoprotein
MHEVSNAFVTDGSCMPSIACQNPSLTFMALTLSLRIMQQIKKGNI